MHKIHGCKLTQPLTVKGFYSAGSGTDCDTEEPGVKSHMQNFFSVYKANRTIINTLIEQSIMSMA